MCNENKIKIETLDVAQKKKKITNDLMREIFMMKAVDLRETPANRPVHYQGIFNTQFFILRF